MGISEIKWHVGSIRHDNSNIGPVRPILIEHSGMKRRSKVDIISLGKTFAVRLREGVGSSRSTTTIPSRSLTEACSQVRCIMEGAKVNGDGHVVGEFIGRVSTFLEVEI